MSATIAVADLKVGMFIHLDLGWMSHPFPLSSFRLVSAEQIATIRSLGVERVRWCQARSEVEDEAETVAAVNDPAGPEGAAGEPAPAVAPGVPAPSAAELHARRLAAQRAAAHQCERQFSEAGRDLKRALDKSSVDALGAGADAQRLANALIDKMSPDGELCVRVMVESAGDRASAHALNVAVLSLLMARNLALAREAMLDVGVGALMHDIGRLDLPDRVRNADPDEAGPELLLYRDHVALGLARGKRMQLPAQALLVIAQHHELADGTGYPKALPLERIAQPARLVALVNRYDELCNPPIPTRALTPHEALSRLFALYRSKFDPAMLAAFIRMMGIYPPGSIVQLTDERYAMVMAVNSSRPLKPTVLVCDPSVPSHQALYVDLEQAGDLGIRRSLKPQQLPARAAEYLQPRQRVSYFFDLLNAPATAEESIA